MGDEFADVRDLNSRFEAGLLMRCPHCQIEVNPKWQQMISLSGDEGDDLPDVGPVPAFEAQRPDKKGRYDGARTRVSFDWMRCPNDECRWLIVRGAESTPLPERPLEYVAGVPGDPPPPAPPTHTTEQWWAYPRLASLRVLDPRVPDRYVQDYTEAALVVDLSSQASATLSGRVLADILSRQGGYPQRDLHEQIKAFVKDREHPRRLREKLHYLREMRNIGAHTKEDRDGNDEVVRIEQPEAKWCLDVLDELFDYYFVRPAEDKEQTERMDEIVRRARGTALPPLPPDED